MEFKEDANIAKSLNDLFLETQRWMSSKDKNVLEAMERWRREQDINREGKTYLEEAWGHGTTWHGVVRGHVSHHWTGRCCCALKYTNTAIKCCVFCLSVSVCDSSTIIIIYMMQWWGNYYRGQCLHLQSWQTPTPSLSSKVWLLIQKSVLYYKL